MPDALQADAATDTTLPVTCRPGKAAANWMALPGAFALYSGAMAGLSFTNGPRSQSLAAALALCCALCLLGLLPGIFWARRGAVVADEDGLRWRGLGGWKAARWDEVRDYYDRYVVRNQSQTITGSSVLTLAGQIKIDGRWTNFPAFREIVERKALNTPDRQWGRLGTRPGDPWPRVFGYDTVSNRWSPRLLLKLLLMFAAYALVKPALALTGLAALVGWRMTLTTASLYLILVLPFGIMLLVRPLLDYRAVQKRMGERVTVDTVGLVFEGGAGRVAAPWADVTSYGIARAGAYTVETRGGSFGFLGSLGQSSLLKEIIRLYASQASDQDWKVRADSEALGGEAARWSGGRVGVGARVFHYRTRSWRAIILRGLALCLFAGVVAAAVSLTAPPGGPPPSWTPFATLELWVAFPLLLGWRSYRHCGIHLDDDGLTQFTLVGQRRVPWGQVRDYWLLSSLPGAGGVVEGRNGRRISFSSMIVGRGELMAEVVQRAAHCGRAAWGPRPPA